MRFSIIIPAYNVQNYIRNSINSVLEQTFKDYEVIVIDDCSTDDTKKEIEKIKNIKFIKHSENKGLGAARNSGMEVANGEYIIFLDGDDYFNNEEVLEKLNNLLGNNNPDVIYMGFEITGNRKELVIPTEETYKTILNIYPNAWSKCWNRKFLEENNFKFPEKRYYEDVVFVYQTILKVRNYLIADFPVHTYISGRENSITTTIQFKNIYDTIENIKDLIKIKQKESTQEIDKIINKEINMCQKRLNQIMENYMNIDC